MNEDIRLQPAVAADGNSLTELKIATLAPNGPMALAGFRAGDLIVRVNDTPVTTLARAVNLSQEVRASARLTVRVRREANLIEFQFDFE